MSAILGFLNASPARIQALAITALGMLVIILGLVVWALIEHTGAVSARAERDQAHAQLAVVDDAAKACTASVDHAKVASQAAIDAIDELLEVARKHYAAAKRTADALNVILAGPITAQQAGDCNWAWDKIESIQRKAGAP